MKKLLMLLLVAFATMCCVSCSDDDDDKNKDFPQEDPNDPNIVRTITLTINVTYPYTTIEFGLNANFSDSTIGKLPFPQELSIDWGDGSITHSNSHKYEVKGKYNVVISAKNLKWFSSCYGDSYITTINLKECNSLVGLYLELQGVYEINVAGFTELKYLRLEYNDNLSSLNIDGCDKLKYCYCIGSDGCELKSLNIDDCKNLKILELSRCSLKELNIPQGNLLENLDLSSNELDANTLNKIFEDLPQVENGYIRIYDNPGTATCNKSIAENKGWKVDY